MKDTLIIGTRGSNLALIQARMVQEILVQKDNQLDVQIKVIHTKGDKILDTALSKIGDKGLFTKELEVALYNGDIDVAVHSLKDLPTELPEGIILGAVLKREDVRDAFISRDGRTLKEMKKGDVIATSSLRRSSQIRKINPALDIIDIRGNIETRIKKMESGYCDATLLACAGLIRAGYNDKISESLHPEEVVPAVSQGIIGIEVLQSNGEIREILEEITHGETMIMAEAERTFLKILEGGCQVPVGCYSRIQGDEFLILGMVSDLSGDRQIRSQMRGPLHSAVDLATSAACEIIEQGGDLILKEIKDKAFHEK